MGVPPPLIPPGVHTMKEEGQTGVKYGRQRGGMCCARSVPHCEAQQCGSSDPTYLNQRLLLRKHRITSHVRGRRDGLRGYAHCGRSPDQVHHLGAADEESRGKYHVPFQRMQFHETRIIIRTLQFTPIFIYAVYLISKSPPKTQ